MRGRATGPREARGGRVQSGPQIGEIDVRLLTADDVEGGVEVLVRAFNEFHVSVGQPPLFGTFSQARATLQMALQLDPLGTWAAVWNARKVVGVAVTYRRGGYVSIGPVSVHPLAQSRGVGRMLMRRVSEANADASCLALVHAGSNPHAFTLYRTQGFRVVYPEAQFAGSPRTTPADRAGVREASRADLDAIVALDRKLAAIDRSAELDMLLGFGRTYVSESGYLVTVRLGDARGIGPGAAEDAATMRSLLAAALHEPPPAGVTARVPANGVAFDVLVGCGLVAESVGNMMAAGTFPDRRGEHVHPVFPEVL